MGLIKLETEQQALISSKTNGVHAFKFYCKYNKNEKIIIKYEDYLRLKKSGEKAYTFTHVGFKHNIDDDLCAITLFTSKPETNLPGLFDPIKNIQLENKIFKYANPVIYYNSSEFAKYYTIHNNKYDFPYWIHKYRKELIVEQAVLGFMNSYKLSQNKSPFFANIVFSTLYYKTYDIHPHYIWRLKSFNEYQLRVWLGMNTNTTYTKLCNYHHKMEKMENGFNDEEMNFFLTQLW